MPPSRTRTLERGPRTRAEIAGSSRARKYERSLSSAGSNSTCAEPPVLNHDKPAIGAWLAREPRRPGLCATSFGAMSGRMAGVFLCGEGSIEGRFSRELARQRLRPLRDIARAKKNNVV